MCYTCRVEHVKSRREQYVESTRTALLDTGRRHFTERGFADVSAEELVRAAGLTRGALYHHFNGKQGLFEAVFEEYEDEAAQRIAAAVAGAGGDPWHRGIAGIRAFLDICAEPGYRQIVLLQGPIALGWQRWRELDQRYLGALLEDGLTAILGATVVFAATGRSPDELLRRGARMEVDLSSASLNARTRSVLTRLVDLEPSRRPKSASDALRALRGPTPRSVTTTLLLAAVVVLVVWTLAAGAMALVAAAPARPL